MGGLLFDLWRESPNDRQNFQWMVLSEGSVFNWDLAQGTKQVKELCIDIGWILSGWIHSAHCIVLINHIGLAKYDKRRYRRSDTYAGSCSSS
mmetsp:Transcript_32704/g.59242  ORF Transcript_32704/g.59242 Transcript_32704/m.59242 type:complete len:92 (+) Transcript_32704:1147-1422(+)